MLSLTFSDSNIGIHMGSALCRGFDLGISATALIKLDASFQRFLAIEAKAFATASAGVRAQLQTHIDLFSLNFLSVIPPYANLRAIPPSRRNRP